MSNHQSINHGLLKKKKRLQNLHGDELKVSLLINTGGQILSWFYHLINCIVHYMHASVSTQHYPIRRSLKTTGNIFGCSPFKPLIKGCFRRTFQTLERLSLYCQYTITSMPCSFTDSHNKEPEGQSMCLGLD